MAVPALITPSRRLIVGPRGFRKPARPVLDPNDPINRGLVGCWPIGFSPPINTANFAMGCEDISLFRNDAKGNFSNQFLVPGSHHGGFAYYANDVNHYISAPDKPWLGLNNFTICAWANPLSGTGSGLFGKRNASFNYALRIASGVWQCYTNIGGAQIVSGATGIITNKYQFVCGTYDGANLKVWLNGNIDGTLSVSGTPAIDATAELRLGAVNGDSSLNGYADGFRVYNRALSAAEIQRLYAEPWAGIYEAAPRWRVGVAAAGGGSFNPGWASGATRTIGVGVF